MTMRVFFRPQRFVLYTLEEVTALFPGGSLVAGPKVPLWTWDSNSSISLLRHSVASGSGRETASR